MPAKYLIHLKNHQKTVVLTDSGTVTDENIAILTKLLSDNNSVINIETDNDIFLAHANNISSILINKDIIHNPKTTKYMEIDLDTTTPLNIEDPVASKPSSPPVKLKTGKNIDIELQHEDDNEDIIDVDILDVENYKLDE